MNEDVKNEGPKINRLHRSLIGHIGEINDVVFASNGKIVVTASGDETVKFWDMYNGVCTRTYQGAHSDKITSVDMSPDGKYLVTGSVDKTSVLWLVESGEAVITFRGHTFPVYSVAFSPDGKRVLTGSGDATGKIWDIFESGTDTLDLGLVHRSKTLSGHDKGVTSVVFSADSSQALTASNDGTARLWKIDSATELKVYRGHQYEVTCARFSRDEKQILTGGNDKTVRVWDLDSEEELYHFEHEDSVTSIAVSPSHQIVLATVAAHAVAWDLSTQKKYMLFEGHTDSLYSCAFSPNGKHVITSSLDSTSKVFSHFMTLNDVTTLCCYEKAVSSLNFSADGQQLITGSSTEMIYTWNVYTGKRMNSLKGLVKSRNSLSPAPLNSVEPAGYRAAFSPADPNVVALGNTSNRVVRLWDIENSKEVANFQSHFTGVTAIVFSPDGKFLLTGSMDKTAKLWNTQIFGEVFSFSGHIAPVCCGAYSPDGRRVMTGGKDNLVKIWDTSTGGELMELSGHTDEITAVAFSPGNDARGRVLTGSMDGNAIVWDVVSGEKLNIVGHDSPVLSLNYSPHGHRFVTGAANGTVSLWDSGTSENVMNLLGHTNAVHCVVFSPDGHRIASGSADTTVKIWYLDAYVLPEVGVPTVSAMDKTIVDYVHSDYTMSLAGTIFENHRYLMFSDLAGCSIMDYVVSANDLDNIKFCAQISPAAVLQPRPYNVKSEQETQSMLKYFIRQKQSRICAYLSKLYTELLLPVEALVDNERLLTSSQSARYDLGVPICDVVDVYDLVLLAEEYPVLFLNTIQNLRDVKHSSKLVATWHTKFSPGQFIVRGSSDCFPSNFWNDESNGSLGIDVPVQPSILPLRFAASMKADLLGAIFRAANGDIMPFDSVFVEVLVDFKWYSHVRARLIRDWFLYVIMSILFCVHAVSFTFYCSDADNTFNKIAGVSMYVLVVLLHIYFVIRKVKQALVSRKGQKASSYHTILNYFTDLWKLQEWIQHLLVSVTLIYYMVILTPPTGSERFTASGAEIDRSDLRLVSYLGAIATPMYALGFLFYLQAFTEYGALVRMIFNIIESTSTFVGILVILILGYGTSFNLIARTEFSNDLIDDPNWNTISRSLVSSTMLVMGDDSSEPTLFATSYYSGISVTLVISFFFLIAIILLNLLIAIMSDKYAEVKGQERAAAIYNRAGVVVQYEELMSAEEKARQEYSPEYLHVLRPEVIRDEDVESHEINVLKQVFQDRTEELRNETTELKNLLQKQIQDMKELRTLVEKMVNLPRPPSEAGEGVEESTQSPLSLPMGDNVPVTRRISYRASHSPKTS